MYLDVVESIVFSLRIAGTKRQQRHHLGHELLAEFRPYVDPGLVAGGSVEGSSSSSASYGEW